jgi:Cu(I)/Ag(I) efflux system periplasmic protein CusF
MKPFLAAVMIAFAGATLAQSGHDHKMEQKPAKKADAQTHTVAGTVKSVNADKGTVTIDHDAVPSMKWPRMTMAFKPQDKKLLQTLKPGQKIEFEFQQRGKDYVITGVR